MRSFAGFKHLATRDWRRVLRAGASAGTVTSNAAVDPGQTWTISCMVFIPRFGTAFSIWNSLGSGGLRFLINTTGNIVLNNAVDTAITSTNVVPLGTWIHVAATYNGTNRAVQFFVDGELFHTATLGGTTTWISAIVTTSVPPGGRVTRLQYWNSVLTQAQLRADFYSWTGPVPTWRLPINNGVSAAAIVADVGAPNGTLSGLVWDDNTPGGRIKVRRPVGYSIQANGLPDGTSTLSIYSNPLVPASVMTACRAANKIVIGAWFFFQGAPGQSFSALDLTQAGSVAGVRLRFDCTTAAGQVRPTINGRLTTAAGAVSALPGTPIDILPRVAGRWCHVAAVVDYVGSTVQLFLDGLPWSNAEAFTPTGTYHSDSVVGDERIFMGCVSLSTTAGQNVRTLQTDHFIAAQATSVDTASELRRLVLKGTSMTGTVWRALWREGSGIDTVESVTGTTYQITRDGQTAGANGVAASGSWRIQTP